DQLAIIDLQAVLDAPRNPLFTTNPALGFTHNITSVNNLISTGAIRFITLFGHPTLNNPTATSPVTGTTATASVSGSAPAGESTLTYTWSATGPAPVVFTPNGTNAAKNTTATYAAPGSYTLTATL